MKHSDRTLNDSWPQNAYTRRAITMMIDGDVDSAKPSDDKILLRCCAHVDILCSVRRTTIAKHGERMDVTTAAPAIIRLLAAINTRAMQVIRPIKVA